MALGASAAGADLRRGAFRALPDAAHSAGAPPGEASDVVVLRDQPQPEHPDVAATHLGALGRLVDVVPRRGEVASHQAESRAAAAALAAWAGVDEHQAATHRGASPDVTVAFRPESIVAADREHRAGLAAHQGEVARLQLVPVAAAGQLERPRQESESVWELPEAPGGHSQPRRRRLWPSLPAGHRSDCRDVHSTTPLSVLRSLYPALAAP